MDLAEGFLEVEVFIHLLGGNADVTAGGEAPVVGCDFFEVYQFDQAFHVAQFGVGEAFGEPMGLFPEVAHLFELFHGQPSRFVSSLAGTDDVAANPGLALFGVTLIFTGVDETSRQFVSEVRLFDQVAALFGEGFEGLSEFEKGSVGGGRGL